MECWKFKISHSCQTVSLRYPLALTGSRDKSALLWDLERGVAIRWDIHMSRSPTSGSSFNWTINLQNVRELKHSTDVRTVFMNNKILVTTDDLKDIYLWDLELPSGGSSDSSYQRQRNTCIRSLTGLLVFVFISHSLTNIVPRSQWACSQHSLWERHPLELWHNWSRQWKRFLVLCCWGPR